MGYKTFGKDHEVGHLLFLILSPFTNNLLVVIQGEKE